jgi:hypothetical protein
MSLFWTLDENHNPVPTDDAAVWHEYRRKHKRVAFTQLPDCWVSTTFLGMDHGWSGDPPILFETMAFKGQYSDGTVNDLDYTDRYATWDEAVAGHAATVEKIRASEPQSG